MAIMGFDAWLDKLGRQDMPALATVIKELNDLTGSDDTEINQLADAILKDANLTSQVLRIANSVHFNPTGYPLNTVSRAIVLIGFSGVRAICVSVMMIDSLLGSAPREHLLEQMARGFHAAVQARNLIRPVSPEVQEEVFIAALLYNLGAMAFWACGGEAAGRIDDLLREDHSLTLREATEATIGTSFKSLSRGLAELWKLGDTLRQALYPVGEVSAKVRAVILGEELSGAARHGWDAEETDIVIRKIMGFAGTDYETTRRKLMDSADEAAEVALTYGAARVCHLIPSSFQPTPEVAPTGPQPFKPNPSLQLSVLRDLSTAVTEALDVNTIFQMVLEGMHRGIGLERVALGFIQQEQVRAKYVLGDGTQDWRQCFSIPLQVDESNLFTYALAKGEPIWIRDMQSAFTRKIFSPVVRGVLGCLPCMVGGVRLNGRDVAVFYADRWKLGGQIDDDQFQSFRHFVLQTQMSLQLLADRRRQPG